MWYAIGMLWFIVASIVFFYHLAETYEDPVVMFRRALLWPFYFIALFIDFDIK